MNQFNDTSAIRRLREEPWVEIANGEQLANWSKNDEIIYNQGNRISQRLAFFVNVFDFISSLEVGGDYFEFGCHRCRTFRLALTEARRHQLDVMRFYAFDSFEGLPEHELPTGVTSYVPGALSTSEASFMKLIREHGLYVDHVHTVKGFYQDSLTTDLQQKMLSQGVKASLINVDCDLYESAVPVFNFIEPFLQEGTILYLDEYFVGYKGSPVTGPAKAFREFEKRSRFKFEPHMQVGWWGRTFVTYLDK